MALATPVYIYCLQTLCRADRQRSLRDEGRMVSDMFISFIFLCF